MPKIATNASYYRFQAAFEGDDYKKDIDDFPTLVSLEGVTDLTLAKSNGYLMGRPISGFAGYLTVRDGLNLGHLINTTFYYRLNRDGVWRSAKRY